MPLPKLTDLKSSNNYDVEEDSKSFRAKIAENINFTRLAKEIELNQNKNFQNNHHRNNNNKNNKYEQEYQHVSINSNDEDEVTEEENRLQPPKHAEQQKQIFQNRHSKKIISLNYQSNDDEVIEPTKKIVFNKTSNKYKNKLLASNEQQLKTSVTNSKNSINSTELFQLNDKGSLLKIVKLPLRNSQKSPPFKSLEQSPLRTPRTPFEDRRGFDEFEFEDEKDDEILFNSSTVTPVIHTSRSVSSRDSSNNNTNSQLNIEIINKYKQKRFNQ